MAHVATEATDGAGRAEGSANPESDGKPWVFEVLYDGDCPLCLREIKMLRWLDKEDKLLFTDIAAADFSPEREGKDMATLMAEIHGRLPDGTWVVGAEVFRYLYGAVGFDWAVAISRWPLVKQAIDGGYKFFAKYRLPLTGRRCDADSCKV
ncbi:MAG: DUF393 domain-containing protein [Planctomycetota bacterium]